MTPQRSYRNLRPDPGLVVFGSRIHEKRVHSVIGREYSSLKNDFNFIYLRKARFFETPAHPEEWAAYCSGNHTR
jgi:hypothetical protein